MTTTAATGAKKPIKLRIIFILNALKILITFGFFTAFKYFGFTAGELEGDSAAMTMFYAAFAYMALFAMMVASILKRLMVGIRSVIVVDLILSIFIPAPIGIAISIVSLGLTFTQSVRNYFSYRS
ncbi:hypothetical protein [Marinomonas posidonica]|uniref:Uncharacterized protein n=1 Tax=Marinomonas posidonica (strain CECT 7376 / NCIMB 14433 / IVIA-Po-181) TaxID=491952 RepID=F6CWM6_MARPP|nr:hypothetical protein [Marinomonas posidonica]AEF54376.1 hypothetical protein Mar181_1332 [Marinomonas posidonica IVIA-Po-181]